MPNTFVISCRSAEKNGTFGSEPGSTLFLNVPPKATKLEPTQIIPRDRWRRGVAAAAAGAEDPVSGMLGDILVFIHGYNNDTETVLWRTRTLQATLAQQGWKGLVVAFDWPSDNSTLNYLEDRSDAASVALRLVQECLDMLVEGQLPRNSDTPQCRINVHLLGHSTGAYVIMEAFAQAEKVGGYFRSPWRLGQVAFIGGDVSKSSLEAGSDRTQVMLARIMRLTNYSNGCDGVLAVSNAKRLGTSPRAGRVGLPEAAPEKMVNVDCTDYFKTKDPKRSQFRGTFCHSWHVGDPVFALDLALVLEGDLDRNAFPTRARAQGELTLVAGGERPKHQAGWKREAP